MKPRARLTKKDVLEIFQLKGDSKSASQLGALYGVSEKTVRDIWTRRTWSMETRHLDTSQSLLIKNIGRPKGSKDSKPRKKKESLDNAMDVSEDHHGKQQEHHGRQQEYAPCLDITLATQSSDEKYLRDTCAAGASQEYTPSSDVQPPSICTQASMRRGSIDDELHEWAERCCCRPRLTDPFRKDWNPARLVCLF